MINSTTTYQVGDATIVRVTETVLTTLTPAFVFPDWDASVLAEPVVDPHAGTMDESREHLLLSVHTWIVRLNGRTILIDTGIGNAKDRPFSAVFHQLNNPFLERLEAVGVRPEDVDDVLITHLHVDHVGWNTRWVGGRWLPTFPKATYVYPKAEEDFYSTPQAESRRMIFEDSVVPIIESGQAKAIPGHGGTYLDNFTFHPTPGHSVGHMSISLESRGECALFTGDIAHHPVQVYRPEWSSVFCADASGARRSRRWAFEFGIDRNATLFTAHFPQSSAGRITRVGSGFQWAFV